LELENIDIKGMSLVKIIESYKRSGWKGPLKVIYSNPSPVSRHIYHWIRLLRALCNLALNISRDGASITSLGSLCQCFTTLIVKNYFLVSSLNLPSFSLKPLPLVLSQQILLKKPLFEYDIHV